MTILSILTILSCSLMTGSELAVSLFVNPAIDQLHLREQAQILKLLAVRLGRAMPFWYIASLLLLFAADWAHRHEPALPWLLATTFIWIATIVFTVTTLVPINNRVAAIDPNALTETWKREHTKWDRLHRLRVLLLIVATVCLTYSLVGRF
jgi:uncharacterized membrane protein